MIKVNYYFFLTFPSLCWSLCSLSILPPVSPISSSSVLLPSFLPCFLSPRPVVTFPYFYVFSFYCSACLVFPPSLSRCSASFPSSSLRWERDAYEEIWLKASNFCDCFSYKQTEVQEITDFRFKRGDIVQTLAEFSFQTKPSANGTTFLQKK